MLSLWNGGASEKKYKIKSNINWKLSITPSKGENKKEKKILMYSKNCNSSVQGNNRVNKTQWICRCNGQERLD